MPGYPLRQLWHGRGRGKLPDGTRRKTVHDFIDEEMASYRDELLTEYEDKKSKIARGYTRFNSEYGEETAFDFRLLWDAADQWLSGVP